jgi:hypothetical protein
MPRFVLLFHQCPPDYERGSHWDLMFEEGGALRTWALAELPRDWQAAHRDTLQTCGPCPPPAAGDTVEAEELADHRLAYLDYEGPISGDRGAVTRVEAGTYQTVSQTPDRWEITIAGCNLQGRVTLSRVQPGGTGWLLSFQSDPLRS